VGEKETSTRAVDSSEFYTVSVPLLGQAERLAKMGSWVWDLRSDHMTWSDELYRILGYEFDEVPATIGAFYAAIHESDVAQVKAGCASLQASGKPIEIQCRVVGQRKADDVALANQVKYVVLAVTAIVDRDGEVERLAGTVLDVTVGRERNRELRRTNRLLQETQRLAHIGSWEWDMRSNRVKWSAELRRIFGEEDDFMPTPESFRERVHPKDLERMQWLYSSVRDTKIDQPVEFRIVRKDKATRYVYLESRAIHDRNGALVGYVGTIQDTTDRRRLEAQALQSQKMEALGRLAGGVAHDFNNVLMAILANASVLQLMNGDDVSQETEDIIAAAETGAALSRQLLALSRQAPISLESLDLNQICHATMHLVQRVLGEDIDVELSLAEDLWTLQGAVVQLKQVLLNLCINARDAMPEGGSLRIETENIVFDADDQRRPPGLRAGKYVHLVVVDDGEGMDEETRARAFEPFFTTKGEGKGSGLGLATVFAVVKQGSGTIDITSAKGHGTRFDIYLPRMVMPESRAVVEPPAKRTNVVGNETILVVEDNPMVAVSIARVLGQAGYSVVRAERPSEAIAAVDAQGDDIKGVVTDYLLPEMRGSELIAHLAARGFSPPVLFVSGYAPAEGEVPASASARFLQKPFQGHELLRALRDLLDAPAAASA